MNLICKRSLYVLLICAVAVISYRYGHDHVVTGQIKESRVLVTAAHLGEIDGYICVYVDEETDYSVHVSKSYASVSLCVGDVVDIVGTRGVVDFVTDKEFSVAVDNASKVVPGVSGSCVYHEYQPVGFVSGWNGSGSIRCIFF